LKTQPGFGVLLLQLLASNEVDQGIKHAGSYFMTIIYFLLFYLHILSQIFLFCKIRSHLFQEFYSKELAASWTCRRWKSSIYNPWPR